MKKILLFAFSIFFITISAETINFSKLSIEEAISLAESRSFDYLVKELDKKLTEIDDIKLWKAYIPELIIKISEQSEYNKSEFTGQWKDSVLTVREKISYNQKLFGSDIFENINKKKISNIQREIIETEFKAQLRYFVRNTYANILIQKIKLEYLENLLQQLPKIIIESEDIYTISDNELNILLQKSIISVNSNIQYLKRDLLSYLRLTHLKDVELTSTLEELKYNIEKDTETAVKNNLKIKYLDKDLLEAKHNLAEGIYGYLPEIKLMFNYGFYNDLNVGLSAGLDDDGFSGNLHVDGDFEQGEKFDDGKNPDGGISADTQFEIGINTQKLMDAGLNTATQKVTIEKVKLQRLIAENEIYKKLFDQLENIKNDKSILALQESEILILNNKRSAYKKMVDVSSDSGWWFFEKYQTSSDQLLNSITEYFQNYLQHYKNINFYYYIVDGGNF